MTIQFKCNHTGQIYAFVTEHDIRTMREHPEYTEIKATVVTQTEEPVKKVGRPKKEQTEE